MVTSECRGPLIGCPSRPIRNMTFIGDSPRKVTLSARDGQNTVTRHVVDTGYLIGVVQEWDWGLGLPRQAVNKTWAGCAVTDHVRCGVNSPKRQRSSTLQINLSTGECAPITSRLEHILPIESTPGGLPVGNGGQRGRGDWFMVSHARRTGSAQSGQCPRCDEPNTSGLDRTQWEIVIAHSASRRWQHRYIKDRLVSGKLIRLRCLISAIVCLMSPWIVVQQLILNIVVVLWK